MDDFNASDCSWKKMVLAKSENNWISSLKSNNKSIEQTMNTNNFSLDNDTGNFANIKKEQDEENVLQNYDTDEDANDIVTHDPLVDIRTVRVGRRTSGPKNETAEERATRLAKMSAYAARRLANETPEQRAMRLKRMSEYAAKRLATESHEQRARRLSRMSAYAARRLANETTEQREARLARMSAYAARRQAIKKASVAIKNNLTNIESVYSDSDQS